MLGISYKSTWFLMHRLREAMRVGGLLPPMGEVGGAVEVDETYIGRVKGVKMKRGGSRHKNAVLSLLDRNTGTSAVSTLQARGRSMGSRPRSNRRTSNSKMQIKNGNIRNNTLLERSVLGRHDTSLRFRR